ncbi:TetR/AcrR family transcriptional regulator, partial [Mycobacterium hodleri]
MDRGSRSKDALLDAAERLIAERGFEVPLRE